MPLQIANRITDIRTAFEGKPVEEYRDARDAAGGPWQYAGDGIKSLYDVRDRVSGFLDDLKLTQYAAVLIVTHQCVLRQIVGILRGLSNEEILEVDVLQGEFVTFEV